MRVHNSLDNLPVFKNAVVSIGGYDGVHLGHRQVIRQINRIAKDVGGESVILTFHPHPRVVLDTGQMDFKLINTLEENIKLFEKSGIDNVVIIPFTRDFAELSASEYIHNFLVDKIHIKYIVIGYNHRFGKNREGDIELLKKHADGFGYIVEEISRQLLGDIRISSTQIRKGIQKGHIKETNSLLGYNFFIYGTVVGGRQTGQQMGFPTANIVMPDPYKIVPADGAYAVRVGYKKQNFKGMVNIGCAPTFEDREHTIEVHIFDFNQYIYGESITIEFVEFLRKEKRFNSPQELKQQLIKDKEQALSIL